MKTQSAVLHITPLLHSFIQQEWLLCPLILFYWGWARFYFSKAVNYGQWVPVPDHSWTHHYMLPSAVSKTRMNPSGHGFYSIVTGIWRYCNGKSVPDTNSLACDCQKRCSNPHKLIFCRSVLLIKSTIVVASIPIACSVSKTQIQHGVQNDPEALCLKECQHGGLGGCHTVVHETCYCGRLRRLIHSNQPQVFATKMTGELFRDGEYWRKIRVLSASSLWVITLWPLNMPALFAQRGRWKHRQPTGWPLWQQWDRISGYKQLQSVLCSVFKGSPSSLLLILGQ